MNQHVNIVSRFKEIIKDKGITWKKIKGSQEGV